ncbi:unnamed protein product [Toxocara canis]|uniref:ATP-dependent Clp protease proteolytic subunit n=1 Tax=Toxocara canis TaxID=6265 RepID=A0A183UEA3_TOXCA|nr:unnamed protein product [Toxocara canis]
MKLLPFTRHLTWLRRLHLTALKSQSIPLVIDNDGRIERVYDIYSRLLKDRIVCVMTPINDQVASAIIAQLLYLQGESSKSTINMYINSPGGSVTAGLGIYDTMQYISAPVATWCIGQGTAADIIIKAEEISRLRKRLNEIYAKHTAHLESQLASKSSFFSDHGGIAGQDVKTIEAALDRDKFMSAEEAKEFGLIDRIEISATSK